jgi:hypothetical protein
MVPTDLKGVVHDCMVFTGDSGYFALPESSLNPGATVGASDLHLGSGSCSSGSTTDQGSLLV